MVSTIFVNYRREDSIGTAGRLYDRLAQVFGRDDVFMDVDHIPAGVDFVAHLDSQIAACDALLVVIGKSWLTASDETGQRRLDKSDDFVAIEIAAALARNIRVIPVLIDGATMPKASELPDSLKLLARRQAIELRQNQFGRDVDALIERLREAVGARTHRLGRRRSRLRAAGVAAAVLVVLAVGGYLAFRNSATLQARYVATKSDGRAEQAETKPAEKRNADEHKRAEADVPAPAAPASPIPQTTPPPVTSAPPSPAPQASPVTPASPSPQASPQTTTAPAAPGPSPSGGHHGWLGVRIQPVTNELAAALAITSLDGALIADLDDRGPAKLGGLQRGDIIVRFDEHDVKTPRDVARLTADTPPDKRINIVVTRNGRQETHLVTIGRLVDNPETARPSQNGAAQNATATIQNTLGLEVSSITDDLRRKFQLKDDLKGVLVTAVDPTLAAEKRLAPGEVILQLGFERVTDPTELASLIEKIKAEGIKVTLVLLSGPDGSQRYVALKLN